MIENIEHVIVLMLENRSFDHMLGYLKHPNQEYRGLDGTESNPRLPAVGGRVKVSPDATPVLELDPNHEHVGHHVGGNLKEDTGVMRQLLYDPSQPFRYEPRLGKPPAYSPNNLGFLTDYELRGRQKKQQPGMGPQIMKCFNPKVIPVLSKLALEFAVCDRWFASVPGQTWPNRNFAHAGTSDGTVNINIRFYFNRTIFQLLREAKKAWRIYHHGIAQAMAFPKLWDIPLVRNNFRGMKSLRKAIRRDQLPAYAFVEPNHGLILRDVLKKSNSQHPGNSEESPRDFLAGEKLIAEIYNQLKAHPKVFNKTVFMITYDEHGGFFDHMPPTHNAAPAVNPHPQNHLGEDSFDFEILGPRVPAVFVSPWIKKGTLLNDSDYEHSSIAKTVRQHFVPGADKLSDREDVASSFLTPRLINRTTPRGDLPKVSALSAMEMESLVAEMAEAPLAPAGVSRHELDSFQESLIHLSMAVDRALERPERAINPRTRRARRLNTALAAVPLFETAGDRDAHVEAAADIFSSGLESQCELRTVSGETFAAPSAAQLSQAVEELEAAPDADARIVLIDGADRSLTILKAGRAVYQGIEDDDVAEREHLTSEQCLELLKSFVGGDSEAARATLQQSP